MKGKTLQRIQMNDSQAERQFIKLWLWCSILFPDRELGTIALFPWSVPQLCEERNTISKRHIRVMQIVSASAMTSSHPYRVMRAIIVKFLSGSLVRLCVCLRHTLSSADSHGARLVAPRDSLLSRMIGKGSMASSLCSRTLAMAANAEMEALQGQTADC